MRRVGLVCLFVGACSSAEATNDQPVTTQIPAHPAPHPGEAPPPVDAPQPSLILDDPPCGYRLNEQQYNGPRSDSPPGFPTTVADRIAAHGWNVETRPAGYIVRMAQAQRGLIPLLLDAQAVEEWVAADRLSECPHATVAPGSLSTSAVEDTETSELLTVSNIAVEPEESLAWTITEAAEDCSEPRDHHHRRTSAVDAEPSSFAVTRKPASSARPATVCIITVNPSTTSIVALF